MLRIHYRSGVVRNINVHPEFFQHSLGLMNGKQAIITPERKAEILAWELGRNPYKVFIIRGQDITFEKVFHQNNPYEANLKPPVFDETGIKKRLRKEFKHAKFTLHFRLGEENINNLLAVA